MNWSWDATASVRESGEYFSSAIFWTQSWSGSRARASSGPRRSGTRRPVFSAASSLRKMKTAPSCVPTASRAPSGRNASFDAVRVTPPVLSMPSESWRCARASQRKIRSDSEHVANTPSYVGWQSNPSTSLRWPFTI